MRNNSIDIFLSQNSNLLVKQRGLPSVGKNPILTSFSTDVEKINDAFKVYGSEIYELDQYIDNSLPKSSLGGGIIQNIHWQLERASIKRMYLII